MAEPLSLGRLARLLLQSWALLLCLAVVGGAAALGASYLLPPVYTATATQLVKATPGTGAAANYEAAQYAVSRAKSYPSFVDSAPVLEGVRNDLGKVESEEALRKELSATNPVDTPLLLVSATGSSAQEAQAKANSAALHLATFIGQLESVAGRSPVSVQTAVGAPLPTDTTSPRRALLGAVGAVAALAIGALAAVVRGSRGSRGGRRQRRGSTEKRVAWVDVLEEEQPTPANGSNGTVVGLPSGLSGRSRDDAPSASRVQAR